MLKQRIANLAKAFFLSLSTLIIVFPAVVAADTNIYKTLQTPFYDPNSSGTGITGCSSDNTILGSDIPPDVAANINKLKDEYIQASKATGVPWQVLAAIHYREASNDPNRDLQAGNPIGGPYTRSSTDYSRYGHPSSMEESAEIAAKHLIAAVSAGIVKKPVNVENPDPEGLKDALYSYNGRAKAYAQQAADLGFDSATQPYEGSPYVMNNFDTVHMEMKIITHDNGGLDGVDTRFGAFTIYAKLGGATNGSSSSGCTPGAAVGSAVQTAINYAWADNRGDPYCDEKPEYAQAINAASAAGQYTGAPCDTDSSLLGIDCGGFVIRVMIDSGADPGYNYGGQLSDGAGNTIQQQAYLEANSGSSGKYEKLGSITDTKDLLPGDIAINSEHTFIYVGSQSGFEDNSASASQGTRAPMARPAYFSNDAGAFTWYRLINNE